MNINPARPARATERIRKVFSTAQGRSEKRLANNWVHHSGRGGLFAIARTGLFALVAAYAAWLQTAAWAGELVRIRVAGAQIPVVNNVVKNVETLTRAIDYAARQEADVLVTPEGSLSVRYGPSLFAAR